MKNERQNSIKKIVQSMHVHTHDELISMLVKEGYKVTQATVSRDIKEIGLIKVPAPDGTSVYSLPHSAGIHHDARVDRVTDSVKNVVSALHTVVINTYPGMASAVAAAADKLFFHDIIGSVAGDDSIIIVTASESAAKELEGKIKKVFRAE